MKTCKIGYDRCGNKVLRVKARSGGFSIQTLGNLPLVHSEHKNTRGNVSLSPAMVAEVGLHVNLFGTERQKRLVSEWIAKGQYLDSLPPDN